MSGAQRDETTAGRPTSRFGRSKTAAITTALAMLVVLLFLPTASTGAYFQASLAPAASTGGAGAWCISPDPAANSAVVSLGTLTPLTSSPTTQMAIIPVANTTAWNAAGGDKTLTARVWSCQDPTAAAMVGDSLRVMGWSNPSTAVGRSWSTGSDTTLGPTSRLNPNAAGTLGAQLASLSTAASVSASVVVLGPGGDLRRYAWMVGGNRSSAATAVDPAPQCTWATSLLLAGCTVATTPVGFASAFSPNPWAGSTTAPVTYTARTMATSGWGSVGSWLAQECGVLALLVCNPVPSNVTMTATAATPATLYGNLSGNQMIWVVVAWTGTVAPPADLSVEIVLQ
ncbi:hypothetical protein ACL9RL_01300 [Plantibacter sp. Mn2098]|uniref:hypothetical protein n=1 Tax=Plantibacter sp. Mn2098 TaxID=3395266 RepID=UPI003BBBE9F4